MQRFDSALELSLHFHMLVPDGVFVADGAVDERPRFVKLEEPSDEEVAELLAEVAKRVTKMLQAPVGCSRAIAKRKPSPNYCSQDGPRRGRAGARTRRRLQRDACDRRATRCTRAGRYTRTTG